jgi:ribosome-associated heat shock protein Hsp15
MAAAGSAKDRDQDLEELPGQDWQRLDRWLWFARAAKSRSFAAALIETGRIRVNSVKVIKPSHRLKIGDVVTSSVRLNIAIWKVLAFGRRRGPAPEARLLYEDLAPPPAPKPKGPEVLQTPDLVSGIREPGAGRPTKRERRQMDRLKGD